MEGQRKWPLGVRTGNPKIYNSIIRIEIGHIAICYFSCIFVVVALYESTEHNQYRNSFPSGPVLSRSAVCGLQATQIKRGVVVANFVKQEESNRLFHRQN